MERSHEGAWCIPHSAATGLSVSLFLGFDFGWCLRLFGDLHHMISMGSSGPKDLIRHGDRKGGTPFELPLRAPFGTAQIDASG